MFTSKYVAHVPDNNGFINYSQNENEIWQILFERQMSLIRTRACDSYLNGLRVLNIKNNVIPQIPELNKVLQQLTGWKVAPVAALISAREFFELLAHRLFPAATFIRTKAELDYVTEPDIFHEIFGHCPMLTDPTYAQFIHDYALKVLEFPESDWPLLQRLFWFTVEFGLIRNERGLKAYGGGILSSIKETVYSVDSDVPLRVLFEPVAAFRTPYRIDRLQPVYFVIDNFNNLYDFVRSDIKILLSRARELGELAPLFEVELANINIHIHAC